MLKPPNEPDTGPGEIDRPVGELVQELIEDGKAYARAELGVVKAIATQKAQAFKLPGILFGFAFLLAIAVSVLWRWPVTVMASPDVPSAEGIATPSAEGASARAIPGTAAAATAKTSRAVVVRRLDRAVDRSREGMKILHISRDGTCIGVRS